MSEEARSVDSGILRKDLMMHVEDSSEFYVSPPSEPNKSEGGFVLGEILELDEKVQNFIRNNLKNKQTSDQ